MVKGMDRRVLMGIVPGLAGLALGTAGFVAASPVLALLAGACALISAAAAVSAVGALRGRDDVATELRERIVELEVAIDAGREALEVTGRFAEMMATREIEATENQPAPVVDRESGLLDERYFEVTLDSRVATARRHLQPVTLLLVTLEGEEENPAAWKETLSSFLQLLHETLRDGEWVVVGE